MKSPRPVPGAGFWSSCDVEIMQVICPTCQSSETGATTAGPGIGAFCVRRSIRIAAPGEILEGRWLLNLKLPC